MDTIYKSKEYRRSRIAYIAQCTFEYLATLLITDAFLAKLLTNIGISDSVIGIITSFVYFSFLFQLFSILLIDKMRKTKGTVIFFDILSQVLFICMYCVPFMKVDKSIKSVLAISAIMIAYLSKYLVSSILFKWANSYVQPNKRGRFSAVKEMISLFCGMIFTLLVGFMVDKYEANGDIEGGFFVIIILLIILNVFNFVSLMGIKDKDIEKSKSGASMKEVLRNTIGNRNFKSVVILLSMWSIACCFTVSFMGTFKTKDLLLSVGLIQVINTIANGMRMALSIPIGKYSDKKSYAKGIELSMTIAAIGFGINVFTTNSRWWFVILFTILYNVSVAGTNANKFNITYSYVKSEYIVQAMAIQNCISGVLGFFASVLAGFIVTKIQQNGNVILGVHIYAQQLLSAISCIIVIGAIMYDKFVVEKQEIMIQ